MNKNASLTLLLLLSFITSCKVSFSSAPTEVEVVLPTPTPTVDPDLFTSTVLSTQSYAYSGSTRSYQLIKTQSGTKNPTYMQWVPNDSNTPMQLLSSTTLTKVLAGQVRR